MTVAVLDASVFVSSISANEVSHETARKLLARAPESRPFLVPALFRVEVIAALARRGESAELLDLVDAMISGPRFHPVTLDADVLAHATLIARTARLRAYDAVYVALALMHDVPIITLDADIVARLAAHYPDAVVIHDCDR